MAYYSAAQLKIAHKIQRTIESFQTKIDSLNAKIARVLGGDGGAPIGRNGKHNMSAAGRARIAAAQKLRWAKVKREGGGGRKMSAAARAKIAKAAKARWAKAKAAGKNRL